MEDNFEWDGEDASAQNDLINNFWKTIDTKQSGNLKGTNLKNKNALDSSEMAAMDKKIAYYEVLNDFTADLSAPSVVSDSANWKKSVTAGLSALVEKYKGSEEELLAYLEEQSPIIEAKATADYCANDYLNTEMSTLVKDYGYAYADDATLQGIIDSYIQNIPEGEDAVDIQQTVVNIIDAYLATAGLNEDANYSLEDLAQFGYSPNASSGLNDLQKSVLKKTIETDLAGSELKEDYANNADLFNTAIETYISELKFTDFETVSSDVLGSFKSSEAYKSVEKNIQVQNILVSDDFKNALTANISDSIAERIVNDGKYLNVMKEIQEEALKKAENGDFDVNGALDTQTAINWLVEQVSARLAEFYPNGFSDMSLDELNVMYDKLVESADKQADTDKQLEARRDAAIQYCKALAEKSTKFAEIVKNTFGDSYASEIGKMLPSEIDAKIEELKAQALELGDANELTLADSSWGNIPTSSVNTLNLSKDSAVKFIESKLQELENNMPRRLRGMRINPEYIEAQNNLANIKTSINNILGGAYETAMNNITDLETLTSKMNQVNALFDGDDWAPYPSVEQTADFILAPGSTDTFNIKPSFTDKDGNQKIITSDRITYKSSNTSIATIDSTGKVTVTGTTLGTYTVTLSVMVDGVEVSKKTITLEVQNTEFDWTAMSDEKLSGTITLDGNIESRVNQSVDLTTLYNSNGCMILSEWNGDWGTCQSNAKKNLSTILDTIKTACRNSGYANTDALEIAYKQTLELYTKLVTGANGKAGNKSNATLSVNYAGENYTYFSKNWYREGTATGVEGAIDQGGKENASGIQWNYSSAGNDSDQLVVNVRCLMDIFNKFYKAALA